MDNKLYCFTDDQLFKLLRETIGLYRENRHRHGQSESLATLDAITGTIEGLDAEAELIAHGEKLAPTYTLQEPADA